MEGLLSLHICRSSVLFAVEGIYISTVMKTHTSFFCRLIWILPLTDKKEKKIFLIYKAIQNGTVAQVIYQEGLPKVWGNAQIYNHIWGLRPLAIPDFATAPFWIFLNMRTILFSFLSVLPPLLLAETAAMVASHSSLSFCSLYSRYLLAHIS